MLHPPSTTLWLPRPRWSSSVYAYVARDTQGCGLEGRDRHNRFPASSFISLNWFLAGSVELLAADGEAAIRELPRWLVIGRLGPTETRNRGDLRYFGISMYPDAFTAAFGVAPQQLDGRLVDAHEVLSPEALAMFGAVAQAPDDERRMAVFEDYLAAHAAGFKASLWQAAVRSGTRLSVRLLSRLLQVGDRQTIRATRKALGVGVSDLRRFARGEAAFGELSARLKDSDKAVSLADIAAEAGYADQSHLSRECKAVTGRTPREFLRGFEGDEADWIYRATRALVDRPDR